ncbi:MAG: 4'-phosphopantetheinyl transferase superfamily protein [Spirochaetes bacterium]|jgi:phosphopantetheinyl transferase|nr:4'-phosphopantetheinyl transferase superfamily protein [Spirochaetota bacterium]
MTGLKNKRGPGDGRPLSDPILSAVEAMEALLETAWKEKKISGPPRISDAEFRESVRRPGKNFKPVINQKLENGVLSAKILTRMRGGNYPCAEMVISASDGHETLPAYDIISALEGVCDAGCTITDVPAEVKRSVTAQYFTEAGASLKIKLPAVPGRRKIPVRLHPVLASIGAASAWAGRFHSPWGFPFFFSSKITYREPVQGNEYYCRLIPHPENKFDIFICDECGTMIESILGLELSPGRTGIQAAKGTPIIPDNLAGRGGSFSIIELETISGFSRLALSDDEKHRCGAMGATRKKSFMASRLACKSVTRKISGDGVIPAHLINTVDSSGLPLCPAGNKGKKYYCSVSHDSRFVVAAASQRRLGIDVEETTGRLLDTKKYYVPEGSAEKITRSPLGELRACARIWTMKEAMIKALGTSLHDVNINSELIEIGETKSRVEYRGVIHSVIHRELEGHVISLIFIEEQ